MWKELRSGEPQEYASSKAYQEGDDELGRLESPQPDRIDSPCSKVEQESEEQKGARRGLHFNRHVRIVEPAPVDAEQQGQP